MSDLCDALSSGGYVRKQICKSYRNKKSFRLDLNHPTSLPVLARQNYQDDGNHSVLQHGVNLAAIFREVSNLATFHASLSLMKSRRSFVSLCFLGDWERRAPIRAG